MAQAVAPPLLPVHYTSTTTGQQSSSPMQMSNLSESGTTLTPSTTSPKRRPYKEDGYQAFSKWMASDDDFFVFRRFESLNANTILWMQFRISELEAKLEGIHEEIKESKVSDNLKNSSFAWDAKYRQERTKIMGELSCLLLQYNQFIDAFSKIRAQPRAEDRQIKNVATWLENKAITPPETTFVQKTGDLITINVRNRPPLGRWIEECRGLRLWKIFRAKPVDGLHVQSEATVYSSDKAFERFTTISIIFGGLVMLLAPLWWLANVSASKTRLQIITGFLIVFASIMAISTTNRPFEVVATTAAYAAVLMVFMQMEGKA
ncbi:hypothetical protein CC86DRAFT_140805 [Ophiobolus disseminans]|uniref:DUF6594 domain-containing protein n=1 Tax=Ophiobolus disseminans TaxID=1469910 RepID=A0A6A7AE73_9PLEO|nr:hypothetical protein CC86DRAFT_140805 [Ophiobolus disseminans]